MTQKEAIARREGREAQAAAIEPDVQCSLRSWSPVGKIRCNCANQPEAWACDSSSVPSGYCTPRLIGMPGDGPLMLPDGSRVAPADKRYPSFLVMPLRAGETPRPCDVVVCSTCPNRIEPPPHIAALKRLGIVGDHDPDTGRCDVLYVVASGKPDDLPMPTDKRVCRAKLARNTSLADMVAATGCGLLVVAGTVNGSGTIKQLMKDNQTLKVWLAWHDTQASDNLNLFYGLPQDLADEIAAKTKAAYGQTIARLLE
jgi:hypothetical protein